MRLCTLRLLAALGLALSATDPGTAMAADATTRIGLLAPLSGTGGPYGREEERGARAALDVVNAAGGVLGHKLELVVADDESVPTAGVAAARKLIDVDGVAAIAGVWSSAVALAVRPVAIEKGIALLVNGSADEITQGDTKGLVWRFQTTGKAWGAAFAHVVRKDGAKTASLLVLQTPFTLSTVQPFVDAFKADGGQILDVVNFNPNQPSYRTEVEKVFAKEPDAVFVASYIPEFSAIVKEAFRSGYTSKLYTFSHAADSQGAFVRNVGKEAAEGVNHVQAVPVGDAGAYKIYLKATNQPEGTIVPFGANVFDEVVVLALAIEKAKSDKAADFTKVIASVANGPGPSVSDPAEALKLARDGKPFRYSGAAADFKFTQAGDQTDIDYGHFRIGDGLSRRIGTTR